MAKHSDKCPICGKPASRKGEHFPFCSSRCRTIDLGNWSSEQYVVSRPVTEADEHYEMLRRNQSNDSND